MSGKRAKQIRRLVYGDSFSPRHRKYTRGKGGEFLADDKRRRYQAIKKGVARGESGWLS